MSKTTILQVLKEKAEKCTKCPDLVQSRDKVVFGEGNPNAKLMCVGEASGSEEDKQGRPFVGPAGQLLDNILLACGLTDVYICNTICCHPHLNRTPTEQECTNCRPFLDLQIKIVNPKCIVCLGNVSAQNLLKTNSPISHLRGIWQSYNNIPVMPTFHPAFLLRNPERKRDVWEDMQKVIELLKTPTPIYSLEAI